MRGFDIIGWLGFVLILFSYGMVATRRWRVCSLPNQLGNILGSVFLGANSFIYQAWVPFTMNLVWGGVALYTLFQILRKKYLATDFSPTNS